MEAIILMRLSPVGVILVIFFVLLVGWDIVLHLRGKKKKEVKLEIEKESPTRSPEEYIEDKWDETLFTNWQNQKIKIRTVKVFGKTEDKDKLIFACSLPLNFTGEDSRTLREIIPELIEVAVIDSHRLMLLKSPAANFCYLNDLILKHLFIYLNRKYGWMNRVVKVYFRLDTNDPDRIFCCLDEETFNHTRLGVLLGNIPGISQRLNTVIQMESKDVYKFYMVKNQKEKWLDLLPKIKEVCVSYFTGGVEFVEE